MVESMALILVPILAILVGLKMLTWTMMMLMVRFLWFQITCSHFWRVLLVVMDADDDDSDDHNSLIFTLASPPGRRPRPPPNASLGDSPSLNPPETFCEWMYVEIFGQ